MCARAAGADVYDRLTIFEDHLVRDINAGRFANHTSLVLVTHGLALRIFVQLLPVLLYALNRRAGAIGQADMDGHVRSGQYSTVQCSNCGRGTWTLASEPRAHGA